MIDIEHIAYVCLGTRNLDDAVTYATKILGLELVARDRKTAAFRSDDRYQTLTYVEDDPRQSVGFELHYASDLDRIAGDLDNKGYRVREGTAEEHERRHVAGLVRFDDPTGNTIELALRPDRSGRRYFPSRDAGITGFSHIGLRTTDAPRDEHFWTTVLNARVSDWIGQAPLLRINEVHHTVALFPSMFSGVQHVNHQVASIDDVMRSWYFLQDRGVRVVFGPGRHATSGAVFLYFEGPDGITYEYSTGVMTIKDEAGYRPRQFPFTPESFCVWGAVPDIPEFRARETIPAMDGEILTVPLG